MLDYNDAQVKAYNKAGSKVSVILLLPNSSNSETDAMRYKGSSYAKYSSFNISSKKGCRTFEALMSYLAKRYGTKENYVAGWILGNEVNNPYEWNYGGNKSLTSYMEQYSRAFHICYNAVRSVSKNPMFISVWIITGTATRTIRANDILQPRQHWMNFTVRSISAEKFLSTLPTMLTRRVLSIRYSGMTPLRPIPRPALLSHSGT